MSKCLDCPDYDPSSSRSICCCVEGSLDVRAAVRLQADTSLGNRHQRRSAEAKERRAR